MKEVKAALKYLGFEGKPLPKMTAFMEANDKRLNAKEYQGNVVEHYYYNINYGKFTAQQLEEWMFVTRGKEVDRVIFEGDVKILGDGKFILHEGILVSLAGTIEDYIDSGGKLTLKK